MGTWGAVTANHSQGGFPAVAKPKGLSQLLRGVDVGLDRFRTRGSQRVRVAYGAGNSV